VKVVDLNLLIYATNSDAPDHQAARDWWEGIIAGEESVGLAWVVLLGYLRLTTRSGLLPRPLSIAAATGAIDEWLQQPVTVLISPGDRHWSILKSLLDPIGAAGNLTTDAHLAALAIEHGATLCSSDRDFARFKGLKHENPLA
jgi:toxin-antitoxin system PIN domain toxin